MLFWDFTCFPTHDLLGANPGPHPVFSCHISLVSSNLLQFLSFSLYFPILILLRFSRTFLRLGLSDVFMDLKKNTREVACASQHAAPGLPCGRVSLLVVVTLPAW